MRFVVLIQLKNSFGVWSVFVSGGVPKKVDVVEADISGDRTQGMSPLASQLRRIVGEIQSYLEALLAD